MEQVKAWVEIVLIPTYAAGKPEKNPIFLEKRVYQGSRGAIYPHPVTESISEDKELRSYKAVFLENEFLQIMILPELGGRIQRAYDKIRQRDFIYYNQVIKPALVGLAGPWISGGIEFNWPQHHRPSTFDPVDFCIRENEDGGCTVWVNEVERMSRTRGMAGFTLYPDKAYLEIKGRIFNRTPFPQTFLWWANPAVKVNEHYQSIFPPDVHAVFDHGRRDVSSFPIATGTYYKVDYSPGTDISRYSNIPVPTSFMAVESAYDFIGGYEHDSQAGMLHVANHHISPGKKQWTWGSGDFGKAWDRNLTDDDGPYIELMCGVFTDNQPDFSWLEPNEEKTFEQYFFPYAGIGEVKNATKEIALNSYFKNGELHILLYATARYAGVIIEVSTSGSLLANITCQLSPEKMYRHSLPAAAGIPESAYSIIIKDSRGNTMLQYQFPQASSKSIPEAATAAPAPEAVDSIEKLFLHGLHLEQYRHATYDARDYYTEALRRDPEDIRSNNALGLWYLRRSQPQKAETYLRRAVKSITLRNPNPYDGGPLYNLALCLLTQDKTAEAYDYFYKSTWNDACQHNGFLQLARIECRKKNYGNGIQLINQSLNKHYQSATARHLKAVLLRLMGKQDKAKSWIDICLDEDPFNLGLHFEKFIAGHQVDFNHLPIRQDFNSYAEYALDYAHAGCYDDALALLQHYSEEADPAPQPALRLYYMGWLHSKAGATDKAANLFEKAAKASSDYCFPSKTEETIILETAIRYHPNDAMAYYYLGNYWYAHSNPEEAIRCWEQSVRLNENFPTSRRNLSLAYFNKQKKKQDALEQMEKAFALDNDDARLLMELDLLYKLCGYSPWYRLSFLEKHTELVEKRHDLYMERIGLYNQLGDFETARALIAERNFQPWEGGEGKIVLQYVTCHMELAKEALENNQPEQAVALLACLDQYPFNLGEGKLPGKPENDLHYWKGRALQLLKREDEAMEELKKAQAGDSTPLPAIFYNDPQPDNIFYQAKALQACGNYALAETICSNLVRFGEEHLNDDVKIDYFAVSLPELMVFDQDLKEKNRVHCYYMAGLGHLGLGDKEKAKYCFTEVLKRDQNHLGAIVHQNCRLL